jgi:hypothetical protein
MSVNYSPNMIGTLRGVAPILFTNFDIDGYTVEILLLLMICANGRISHGIFRYTSGLKTYLDEGLRNFTRGARCGKIGLSLGARRASWLPPALPVRFPPHGSASPVTMFSSFSKPPVSPLWNDTGSEERPSNILNG